MKKLDVRVLFEKKRYWQRRGYTELAPQINVELRSPIEFLSRRGWV